jgi:N-acetylneuraminic acid mutarotase
MGGSQQYDQLPTPTAPGAPEASTRIPAWADKQGNFWMFGAGADSTGMPGEINAMWNTSPASDATKVVWNIAGGSITFDKTACFYNGYFASPGVWGTEGQPAATNIPSGRSEAARTMDAQGNLWLFGGNGCDAAGNTLWLNDLWEFNTATKQWAWVAGGSIATPVNIATDFGGGNTGVYGTKGTSAPGNTPGGRQFSVMWTDAEGNLWLFGGYGCDSTDWCLGDLNDLWKFDTTMKQWTWIAGSSTNVTPAGSVNGVYGTLGVASPSNTPGGRNTGVGWTDAAGKLWLYGGSGYDSTGNLNTLIDLWRFDPSTAEWTWMGGSDVANVSAPAVYGAKGTAAATNSPGSRVSEAHCADASGSLWIFGGIGHQGELNDLWKFDPTTMQWTWEAGGQTADLNGSTGSYGTEGVASASNVPMARDSSACWFDPTGNFWLFGGGGEQINTVHNDLWKYQVVN